MKQSLNKTWHNLESEKLFTKSTGFHFIASKFKQYHICTYVRVLYKIALWILMDSWLKTVVWVERFFAVVRLWSLHTAVSYAVIMYRYMDAKKSRCIEYASVPFLWQHSHFHTSWSTWLVLLHTLQTLWLCLGRCIPSVPRSKVSKAKITTNF